MARRLTVFVGVLATAWVMTAGPAFAGNDSGNPPPGQQGLAPGICSILVTPGVSVAGESVSGSGFQPGVATEIFFDTTSVGSATADANGQFAEVVAIPALAAPGSHTVTAQCQSTVTTVASGAFAVLSAGQIAGPTFLTDPNSINCAGALSGFVTNAEPGTTVTFSVRTPAAPLASDLTDANGQVDFTIASFANGRAPGQYEIVSNGLDRNGDPFELSARVDLSFDNCTTVLGATFTRGSDTGRAAVPRTGTEAGPMVAVGAAAMVGGAALVTISRRRRRRTSAAAA
jgi:LPXTG-motif cell wall-anchored protein